MFLKKTFLELKKKTIRFIAFWNQTFHLQQLPTICMGQNYFSFMASSVLLISLFNTKHYGLQILSLEENVIRVCVHQINSGVKKVYFRYAARCIDVTLLRMVCLLFNLGSARAPAQVLRLSVTEQNKHVFSLMALMIVFRACCPGNHSLFRRVVKATKMEKSAD